MTLPNFLVAGAAKCGTDSLCKYLSEHPQVYISPRREPNFFMAEGRPEIPFRGPGDRFFLREMWVSTREEYESLFADVTCESAIGEGTAWYIYDDDSLRRIKKYVPDMKLVVSLRNPVDRAYSAYNMLLGTLREPYRDFGRALDAEGERMRRNWEPIWYYVDQGFYARQLRRCYELFDPRQVHIILYDDLDNQPLGVLHDLFQFLDVDDRFVADTSRRYNVSSVPRSPLVHTLLAGGDRVKGMVKPFLPLDARQALKRRVFKHSMARPVPMQPAVRLRLIETFRADVLELEEMLCRDLSHWLE